MKGVLLLWWWWRRRRRRWRKLEREVGEGFVLKFDLVRR